MIGLDTNVLVRYLVQDDPGQSRKATQVIAKQCTRDDPGFINRIVLCELVWVLESAYGYSKDTIVAVLEKLLRTSQLKIEDTRRRGPLFACIRKGRQTLPIVYWEPPIGLAGAMKPSPSIMPPASWNISNCSNPHYSWALPL
jgi:predicted nucleic acid-binding protein